MSKQKTITIEIGYEDCYFGFFHKVKEIQMDKYNEKEILLKGRKIVGEANYPFLAWQIKK